MKTCILSQIIVATIFLIQKTSSTCPSKCSCERSTIACVKRDLEDVPLFETIDIDPLVIDLSGNKLISIDIFDFSFEKNTGIRELYLNNSELTDIEDKCFDELMNLQELYLNGNNLKSLPMNIIRKNQNMVVMDLSNNIFERLPTINSTSLEVLALANSGISSVPERSLNYLPNLRLLLLQENKLKELSVTMIDNLQHFFFIKLTYNLWHCNCKTVELFDFLTQNEYTEITTKEPIQCMTQEKNFINIYYSNGSAPQFERQCKEEKSQQENQILKQYESTELIQYYVSSTIQNHNETITEEEDKDNTKGKQEVQENTRSNSTQIIHKYLNRNSSDTIIQACGSDDFYELMKIILLIIVPLTFLIGMIFGSYVMYAYGSSYMKLNITESSKRLLSPSIEAVKEEACV